MQVGQGSSAPSTSRHPLPTSHQAPVPAASRDIRLFYVGRSVSHSTLRAWKLLAGLLSSG